MTRRSISWDEVFDLIFELEATACRLELQPVYRLDEERPEVERFLAGDLAVPEFTRWETAVAAATAAGKRIERVRVLEDPPTDYQRWLLWMGQATLAAGERHSYITRAEAERVGLVAAGGEFEDWWLIDSARLIVFTFDEAGNFLAEEFTDDASEVEAAVARWELAVRHSRPSV